MTTLRTKRYIGGYRVIAPIGAGGFATVYRAIDEETRREVAIKVLAENHSLVAETRRRFLAEIELLRTVDSQSIAQVYEVGETSTGQPYMVLELANRGDLRRRLEEIRSSHQVLGRAELALLAHHLHEALTTLHHSEIVHRDVSPGNILIRSHQSAAGVSHRTGDGSVPLLEPGERFLLADLGHAKDMIRASGFTAGGGTRGFASPEQRDDITVVDLRADIFSATAVIEWAAHDGVHAEDLEPFFDIGLAENPDDRFTSMTEWHAAFSAALGAGAERPTRNGLTIGPIVELVKRGGEAARTKTAVVAAVALACVALATLIFFNVGSDNPSVRGTGVAGITADADGDPLQNERLQSNELLIVEESETEPSQSPLPPLSVAEDSIEGPASLPPTSVEPDSPTSNEPAVSTTTAATETTDSTISTIATTAPPTSAVPESSEPSTTVDGTGSTVDGPPESDAVEPTATIDQPTNSEVILAAELEDGVFRVGGTATTPAPAERIKLMIVNQTSRQYWDATSGQFDRGRVQFDVTVEPDKDDSLVGTWEHTIPAEQMAPGRYLIRVWAEGPTDVFDQVNDTRTFSFLL